MNGSEKQVKWAKDIKSLSHIAVIMEVLCEMRPDEAGKAMAAKIGDWLVSNEDAKWWIDNRAFFTGHSENLRDKNRSKCREIAQIVMQEISKK